MTMLDETITKVEEWITGSPVTVRVVIGRS